MAHDMLAELDGYRSELANYERQGRPDRAKAVQAEIGRVSAKVRVEVEKLLARAENYETEGQDVLAAQCRVEAKRLAREVGAGLPEDAEESAPREAAVPAKKSKGGA